MHFWRRSVPCTALSLFLAAGVPAMAAPVNQHQAQSAVSRWLQVTPRPLKAALASGVDQVISHGDAAGRTLFHEVRLSGGGFVVVAPDDLLEPVLAFAPTGTLADATLLNLMLRRDLPQRLEALSGPKAPRLEMVAAAATSPERKLRQKWDLLQNTAAESLDTAPLNALDDVRVDPLVESRWNQESAGGKATYNLYAPNSYPIGCVATALGQLMRFNQFPTAGIGVKPFAITIDKVASTVNTKGGDGAGGAYNWNLMPFTPGATTTDPERQMIGSLLYDAALSVKMSFESTGSGAVTGRGAEALKKTFGYSNAVYGYNGGGELLGSGLFEMVQPSLDAGYPVILAISGDGGHAIVCDGYGYNAGSLYHHLNMGWGGSSDAWYNLPDIGTFANFKLVHGCLYNVFKSGTGDILSGRVTDASGKPVAGAVVSNGTRTATTNARGIYALMNTVPGTHTLTASKGSDAFSSTVRVVEHVSEDYVAVGNAWDLNLVQGSAVKPAVTVQPRPQEAKLGTAATFIAGASGTGPLHFQWSKNGVAVGSDSPIYTTANTVFLDNSADVKVKVTNVSGESDSSAAKLAVVHLYNGSFEKGNTGWTLFDSGVVLTSGAYKEVEPHGGKDWLCIGDWSAPVTDFAVQDLSLPADATKLDLSFWLGIANKKDTPATAANLFRVKIMDANGTGLATLYSKDNTAAEVNATGQVVWKSSGTLNLLPYKGQNVKLRIESVQPGATDTGTIFAVDDVVLTVATSTSTSTVQLVIDHATATALPGGTATFTVTGDQGLGVDWSVTAPATLTAAGLTSTITVPTTLPLTAATYTVTAASKQDSSKTIAGTVQVKGMDLNADAGLDPRDLLVVAKEWNKGTSSAANLKGSGTVDDTDLNALLSRM